ncbi:MAG: MBOAT family protein [Lachnospiraceae bacterium]
MVFSSLLFIFRFLPAFLMLYTLSPEKYQNLVLFLGSLIFYAWGEPVYIGIMLFSTFLDYGNGRLLEYAFCNGKTYMARAVLTESVLVNLSLLGIFKYAGIFPLPIGISFYTFQTMSYTIDVYRREAPVQKDLIAFGAYVAMFPQLIAGPIVRYADVEEELNRRRQTWEDGYEGIGRFCIGLGKKVLMANQIGLLWEQVQGIPPEQMSALTAWIGSLAYALQLYFDFSGYSDMAIGLAQMLGFHLKENFDYPYRSGSITEFWRRWHISLGQWFREYVYIPLGGNRRGLAVQIRNILIVWALTGIWHGKGWNFLVWGLYFGLLLLLEKCFFLVWLKKFPAVGRLYTISAVLVGMTVFALEDLRAGVRWIFMMAGGSGSFINSGTAWIVSNYGILLLLGIFGAVGFGKKVSEKLPVRIAVFFLSIAYLVDAAYNPFLYFRF